MILGLSPTVRAGSASNDGQAAKGAAAQEAATTPVGQGRAKPQVRARAPAGNATDTQALKGDQGPGPAHTQGTGTGTRAAPGAGRIDESARPFSPAEGRIARTLQGEGRQVKALAESREVGRRNADALVDGRPTEFKTVQANPAPTHHTIKNQIGNSIRGRGQQPGSGQARDIIIDARGTPLSRAQAEAGVAAAAPYTRGKLDSVRILGDGYDFTSRGFR